MAATRLLGMQWPEYWDGCPAMVIDLRLRLADEARQRDLAAFFGGNIRKSITAELAIRTYMGVFRAIRKRLQDAPAHSTAK